MELSSIEFEKKCHPYNRKYKELFGYVPGISEYSCRQDEYFSALLLAIETKQELTCFLKKKEYNYFNPAARH